MDWMPILIVAGIVMFFWMLKSMGQISLQAARAHLENGALVIDVRSPGEFRSGHIAKAMNIPLDEIATALPRQVKDKNQVLLLHCLSGTRSGIARAKLKSMGYQNAFNLGSFNRARTIVDAGKTG